MKKVLNRLIASNNEEPSMAELRFMILRLERDEAMESESAGSGLWAKGKKRAPKRRGFLSANMPPLKRKKDQASAKAPLFPS